MKHTILTIILFSAISLFYSCGKKDSVTPENNTPTTLGDKKHTLNSIGSSRDSKLIDLDNDGDLDIIVVNRMVTNNLVWYKNQGSGNFSSEIVIHQAILNASNPNDPPKKLLERFDITDIDNDGDLDIIGITVFDGIILKLINDGAQNFNEEIIDNSSLFDSWVKAIDMNNDGYPNILSGNYFYTNTSGVIDSNGTILGSTTGLYSADQALSHDFDNDSFKDAVLLDQGDIHFAQNNGNNGFNSAQTIESNLNFSYQDMSLCDLDNDGNMDILFPSSDGSTNSSNSLKWYESNGSGNFITHNLLVIDTNYVVTYLYAVDMDNDGDNDLIASMYDEENYDGIIKCFWNGGTNNFESNEFKIITNGIKYPLFFRVGDIDNDGDQDILTAPFTFGHSNSGGISWFENPTN